MGSCLGDETLAALAAGSLDPQARGGALAHLDGCDACRQLVTHVLDTCPAPPGSSPHSAIVPGATIGRYVIDAYLGAGAMALLIEAALGRRYPGHGLMFDRLGKPGPQLFAEARRRVGGRVVMIGDQLETDIAGACAAGIDAALLAGVSRWPPVRPAESTSLASGIAPRYLLATIEP